jgi:hypothetical protein
MESDALLTVHNVEEAERDAEDDNIRIFMEECGRGLSFV